MGEALMVCRESIRKIYGAHQNYAHHPYLGVAIANYRIILRYKLGSLERLLGRSRLCMEMGTLDQWYFEISRLILAEV